MNVKEALRDIISAKEQLDSHLDNQIPFPALVEVTSGTKIIAVNLDNDKHVKIIDELETGAEHLIDVYNRRGRRLSSSRVNEVGNALEDEFVDAIEAKTPLSIQELGASGYPDLEVKYSGITVYLEMKVTSRGFGVSQRTFYYSSARKIEEDAMHILIGFKVSEPESKSWKVDEWRLVDLSGLQTKLKNEFNATNSEIYAEELRIRRANHE